MLVTHKRVKVSILVKPDKILDCLGLYCPEPVFKTRIELDNMIKGELLEVIADDPAAESDITNLIKHLEYTVVSTTRDGNTVRIIIRKD